MKTTVVKYLSGESNLDLYTALSIFVSNAPKLINSLCDAAQAGNLAEMEEFAAKLIKYSNDAQLVSFAEKIKNLVIAAREQKIDIMEKQTSSLKQCFEQMAKISKSIGIEEKTELNSFAAIK